MKPGSGGKKGRRFEWEQARLFSRWVTKGQDDTQLRPSVLSGGWSKKVARQQGDLSPTGPSGEWFCRHFIVECKHHRTIDFWHTWTQKPGPTNLLGWWAHLQTLPPIRDKTHCPLIIFRANNRPLMLGLLAPLIERLRQRGEFRSLLLPHVSLAVMDLGMFLAFPPKWVFKQVQDLTETPTPEESPPPR